MSTPVTGIRFDHTRGHIVLVTTPDRFWPTLTDMGNGTLHLWAGAGCIINRAQTLELIAALEKWVDRDLRIRPDGPEVSGDPLSEGSTKPDVKLEQDDAS